MVFRLVSYDFSELSEWHRALYELLGGGVVVSLDADEVRNVVTVGVRPGADTVAVRSFAAGTGIPDGALHFVDAHRPVDEADLRDTYRPVVGGFEIEAEGKSACTLGFNTVHEGDTAFVTASHCSTARVAVDSGAFTQNRFGPSIGNEILDDEPSGGYSSFGGGFVCPTDPGCRVSDAQLSAYLDTVMVGHGRIAKTTWVSTTSAAGSITLASPPHFNIGQQRMMGSIYVGMSVDKMGRSTGWTRGSVTATCVSINYGYVIKSCQMEADYYSESGDSGAPVFFQLPGDTVALTGIHHSAAASGERYFSTLDGIEYDLGITLDVVGVAYVNPVSASITGPEIVPDDESCTWQGWASGGTSPYEYSWWGALSGSNQNVSGTVSQSSYLWLEVTDAYDMKDTAEILIDVDEDMESCEE